MPSHRVDCRIEFCRNCDDEAKKERNGNELVSSAMKCDVSVPKRCCGVREQNRRGILTVRTDDSESDSFDQKSI